MIKNIVLSKQFLIYVLKLLYDLCSFMIKEWIIKFSGDVFLMPK